MTQSRASLKIMAVASKNFRVSSTSFQTKTKLIVLYKCVFRTLHQSSPDVVKPPGSVSDFSGDDIQFSIMPTSCRRLTTALAICCFLLALSGCGADTLTDSSSPYAASSMEEVGVGKTGDTLSDDLVELLESVSPTGEISFFRMPNSSQFARIPQDPLNPLSSKKVKLGQLLYHETAMAVNSTTGNQETFSCASCHFAQAGFQAGRANAHSPLPALSAPLEHVSQPQWLR